MLANMRFGNVEQEPYLDSRSRAALAVERYKRRQKWLEERYRRHTATGR